MQPGKSAKACVKVGYHVIVDLSGSFGEARLLVKIICHSCELVPRERRRETAFLSGSSRFHHAKAPQTQIAPRAGLKMCRAKSKNGLQSLSVSASDCRGYPKAPGHSTDGLRDPQGG